MSEPQDEQGRAVTALHDALDAVSWSVHDREGDWVDTSGEVIAGALIKAGWTPPAAPVRDHAAAEQSRRDDLARDVARAWFGAERAQVQDDNLRCALDRMAVAYLPDGPQDTPDGGR